MELQPPRLVQTVEEYLARVPPRFRTALQRLRTIIKAAAPDAEELISYRMPAFRQNGMLVYFAAFKDHCSFFVGSPRIRRRFSIELKPFEAGKGTARFTPDRPLPGHLVTRIVKARLAENARRSKPGRRAMRVPGERGRKSRADSPSPTGRRSVVQRKRSRSTRFPTRP